MKSLIIGLIILAGAAFTMLPSPGDGGFGGLGWGEYILNFLRGGLPVLAVVIGIIAVFIGIADMKDRAEAKKEARKAEETTDTVQS